MAFKKAPEDGGLTRNGRLLAYADLLDQGQPVDADLIPLAKEIIGEHLLERKGLLDLIKELKVAGGPTYDVKPLAKMVMDLNPESVTTPNPDLAKGIRDLVQARRSEGQAAQTLAIQAMLKGMTGGDAPSDIGDLPSGPVQ